MTTIKSYTDLEQSKKLAEILPFESADMHWQYIEEDNRQLQWFCFPKDFSINQHNTVLAWSLAALLQVLPIKTYTEIDNACCTLDISRDTLGKWFVSYHNRSYGSSLLTCTSKELLDACYEMVLKLKEKNLL